MKKVLLLSIVLFSFSIWGCKNKDNTPPTITISSPEDGTVVSGEITVKSETADNDRINRVEFFLDDFLFSTVNQEPFQAVWNTADSKDGDHTLYCKAIDDNDNETKSNSINVTASNKLFTAKFTDDWLCADCGEGIIFVSDMDGNVLAEESWTGNADVELDIPEDLTDIPQKISVTTVAELNFLGVTYVFIITHLSIDVGTIWTFRIDPLPNYDNPTLIKLDFQNQPDHHGHALSSLLNHDFSSYSNIFDSGTFAIYSSPMDIYLKLNVTNSNPKFIWLETISNGDYVVDLAEMDEAGHKTIDLQGNSEGIKKYLYGYPNPGKRNEGSYIIDYEYLYLDNIVSSVNVYYPPSGFSEFRTSLYFYDSGSNPNYAPNYWYQTVYGDIPAKFEKIVDFDFINTSPNDFNISTTNKNFNEIRSQWTFEEGNYSFGWFVQGPPDLSNYSLPVLPNSVIEKYSSLNRELFDLSNVELRDHSELNSYEEVMEILYNSQDYFYDVVNDLRLRKKFNQNKKSHGKTIDIEEEDIFINMPRYLESKK
jgi:hypothetical protein